MSCASLGIGDLQLQIDILMDTRLIVYLILSSWFQRGYDFLLMSLAAIGILTG